MSDSVVSLRPVNGVSFGKRYTVTSTDVTNAGILFDFNVKKKLLASILITDSSHVNKERGDLKIDYPLDGQVRLFTNADTPAVSEISAVTVLANTSGSLNGKYFLLSSKTVNYYVWFSTNGTGSDPAVAAHTAIHVNLTAGDSTAASVATQTKAVLDALGAGAVFSTTITTSTTLNITDVVAGVATDATAGTSGFTVSVTQQGSNIVDNSTFNFVAGDIISLVVQEDLLS